MTIALQNEISKKSIMYLVPFFKYIIYIYIFFKSSNKFQ